MKTFRKLLGDDSGGEVIEYALIAGLIVIATIATVAAVGTKVLALELGQQFLVIKL